MKVNAHLRMSGSIPIYRAKKKKPTGSGEKTAVGLPQRVEENMIGDGVTGNSKRRRLEQ